MGDRRITFEEVRAHLAAIVESSDDAIVSKSLDGVVRTWNAGAERIFGFTAQEMIGQPIMKVIPPDRWDEERTILAKLRRGERIEHYETVRVAKDGTRIDVSLTVSPMRDSEGTIIGASKVARDITSRKRVDDVTRDSERRFRTLARLAPVGIFLTDAAGNCEFVNDRWCTFAGMTSEDARGIGWLNALHPDDVGRITQAWYTSTQSDRGFADEFRFRRPDGTVTWLQGNAVALRNDAGGVVGFLGTLSDITELRAASEALKEADRLKDDFIALLAHELRNPLAPLRNGLQIMRLMEHDPVTTAKAREIMERQLLHMVRLIDDLLDVSRISRRKMVLRRSRVLVTDVVSSAVETARPLIQSAGHELVVSLPPESIYVYGDLVRLSQVISNLLTNSAKYTEPPGSIVLTVVEEAGQVEFTVRDNGIGIAPESLEGVFDMFNQIDSSIERSAGGLGIGLALVKGITELHDGTVSAASAGVGTGSTFTIRLPVLDHGPERTAHDVEATSTPTRDPRKILVVDDNADSAASLATMLELLGHQVETADDGAQAVTLAESFRPDLILMDIGMPVMNGYEATRRIRSEPWGATVPIVALTGWGQDADRQKSREAGCDSHIVKPVALADLESVLVTLPSLRERRVSEPGHSG